MGKNCNISSSPCDVLKPCQNNGTCVNATTSLSGYSCACLSGFGGENCQYDRRPCKPDTCWHDGSCCFPFFVDTKTIFYFSGTCYETSISTFVCSCQNGWTGDHCETMINYCHNITCENNGVCRPSFMNYTCECLGESFSGRHCEIVATKTKIRKFVVKSFGYIAIIFLVVVVAFFVIMDILKYCFGIDPTKDELDRIRRAKAMKRAKRAPLRQKFIYVNAPVEERPTTAKNRKKSIRMQETSV